MAILQKFSYQEPLKDISNAVITLTNSLTYNGKQQTQLISVSYNSQSLTEGTDYIVENNSKTLSGTYTLCITGKGNYIGNAYISWSMSKASRAITPSVSETTITGSAGTTENITLSYPGKGALSVSSSATNICTAEIEDGEVVLTSVAAGEATITVSLAADDKYISTSCTISVEVILGKIYGVSWDKTSSTVLTRTDAAEDFADPTPCLNGGTGGSPFDEIEPWAGMVKETFQDGNVMVKIPKFWYKWTDDTNEMKLQIANYAAEGFHVSPAHMERGDNKGERDYVYIGRYHCNSSYKSVSGATPVASITRATARTGCKGVGTGYYQLDYAMWWTVRMLYLVEFANWNSQTVIGYGCGDNSAKHTSGYSDSASYHTGSMQSSRTTYGKGIQYRNIEDPWGNVLDWCDGIVLSSGIPYVTLDVTKYGDATTNHTQVGNAIGGQGSGNEIKYWTVPEIEGLEWALFPKETVSNSSYNTYVSDDVGSSGVVVYVGGSYHQSQGYGFFCSYGNSVSVTGANIGARLQYLP